MTITASAARHLRALPPQTAGVLTQAVEEAAQTIVATGCDPPGCRAILAGWLWRVERGGDWISFGILAGETVIVAVGRQGGKGRR